MWLRRFILFHGKRHPSSMGADQVNAFLSSLAVNERVSASTQNQALSALLFCYRDFVYWRRSRCALRTSISAAAN